MLTTGKHPGDRAVRRTRQVGRFPGRDRMERPPFSPTFARTQFSRAHQRSLISEDVFARVVANEVSDPTRKKVGRQDWDLNPEEDGPGCSLRCAPGAATTVRASSDNVLLATLARLPGVKIQLSPSSPLTEAENTLRGSRRCVRGRRRQDWDLNPESRKGTRFPGVRLTVRPSWHASKRRRAGD